MTTKQAGYPDKTPSAKPPIERVDVYRGGQDPAAACFDVGISDRAGAQEAADARREHSRELGNRRSTP